MPFIYFNISLMGEGTMVEFNGRDRSEVLADYVIETGATVRAAALHFGISKSTVHQDITSKLEHVNRQLHDEVKHVLDRNKQERHLRGGQATKEKYAAISERRGAKKTQL